MKPASCNYFFTLLVLLLLGNHASSQYVWRQLGSNANILGSQAFNDVVCDTTGNVYAMGPQSAVGGNMDVWKWDGNAYTALGKLSSGYSLSTGALTMSPQGKIYALQYSIIQRVGWVWNVLQWNDTGWVRLGGANALNESKLTPKVCTDLSGNVYALVKETSNFFGRDTATWRISKWNGSSWQRLGSVFLNGDVRGMCADTTGNVYLCGKFTRSKTIYNTGGYYVAKWNGSAWGEATNGTDTLRAISLLNTIYADRLGNVYACADSINRQGSYSSVAKWDGTTWSTLGNRVGGIPNSFCVTDSGHLYTTVGLSLKRWEDGQWKSLKTLPTLSNRYIASICSDQHGNIFAGGSFADGSNRPVLAKYGYEDPGAMYVYLDPVNANCNKHGGANSRVYSGTAPYTFLWSNNDTSANLKSVSSGTYRITVTDAIGLQVTGYTIINTACNSIITGRVFNDKNNNCIFDTADVPLPNYNMVITTADGTSYYANSGTDGLYQVKLPDSGVLQLKPYRVDGCGNVQVCNYPDGFISITNLGDTLADVNIAVNNTAFDLALNMQWSCAAPGFVKMYKVLPYNQSPNAISKPVEIAFSYDRALEYMYSVGPMSTVIDEAGHTLYYTLDSSTIPYPTWDYTKGLISYFRLPDTLSLGYKLKTDVVIAPLFGDCNGKNNHIRFSETVKGSFDPNYKEVSPEGYITNSDSELVYTIHYQNMGTDSTHFIVVRDTLSPYVSPASIINLASSHTYSSFNIAENGILTWTFEQLRLPPITADSNTSQGFIVFSVRLKEGLPEGATINNTASIYFDYNTPVQTNTVSNTTVFVTAIPGASATGEVSITASPNPFSDVTRFVVSGIKQPYNFELFDVTGKLQLHLQDINSGQFNVMRNQLPQGVYLYRLVSMGQPVAYGKLVVQ